MAARTNSGLVSETGNAAGEFTSNANGKESKVFGPGSWRLVSSLLRMDDAELPFVFVHHASFNSLVKDFDLGRGELPCADTALEQEVELRECSTLRLGYSEVSVDNATKADSSPEETGIVAPIPGTWIEHVRRENAAYDANDIVQISSKHNGLNLQSASGQLRHQ